MKLQVFDSKMSGKLKPGKLAVRINFKVGHFTFVKSACAAMDLKPGEQMKVGYNQATEEWFLWKDDQDGFTLRLTKEDGNIMFNNVATADAIRRNLNLTDDSALFQIGSEPTEEDGIEYWALLTPPIK